MAGVQLPPDDRTLAAISQRTPALEEQLQRDGCLRLWPHLHGTDGFYAQLLLRQV